MVLHFPKRRAFLPRAYDAETFPRLTFPAQCTAHYAQLAINSLCPWRIYSLPLTYTPSFSFLNGGLDTHLRARLPHCWLVLASLTPSLEVISFFDYQEPALGSRQELRTPEDWEEGRWDVGKGMSPFTHQLSAGNPGAQSASLRLIGGRRRPQFSKGRGCCVESSRPQTWAWTEDWLQFLRGYRLGRPRLKS